jgi:aminoglycoside/choline kinase family phosphotransferase
VTPEQPREVDRLNDAAARFGLPDPPRPAACSLAGDVGGRRYFRVAARGGGSTLIVLYPEPASAAQASWRAIGAALARVGLRVPALHDDDEALGASLIEDLGDRDHASELAANPHEDRPALLGEAEEMLPAIRSVDSEAASRNPAFDAAFFAKELAATRHWALEAGGSAPLTGRRASAWEEAAGALASEAADFTDHGGPVPTHRDFHANNLMRAPDGCLAVIDFQDLRLGPRDYDPVSLRFERAGAEPDTDGGGYREAVLLQRAWKVLGTFEKMLRLGREVYRPHRDTTAAVLRRVTSPESRYRPLLEFL